MPEVPVVTIDGPSGVGKGTVSQILATRLGFHLLDSGALYRLLALAAERRAVTLDDMDGLVALAGVMAIRFSADPPHEPRVWLHDEDVTNAIRSEACGAAASRAASIGAVRAALVDRQRNFRRAPGLVADGRDMGTHVFPSATAKFFLDASAEERASRRYKQLKGKGIDVSLTGLFRDINERDLRDRNRAVSPLRPAPDALLIDTTSLSIEEVVRRAWAVIAERGIAPLTK